MSDPDLKAQIQAATIFEAFFVPALFGQWPAPMLDTARVHPGDHVLDVGCFTGVLAREALGRVGPSGRVVGIDRNPGMVAVAKQIAPDVTWQEGSPEALSFDDASFDVVASAFGLPYFDRTPALREMWRVLKPGGRLITSVWDRLEDVPAYSILVALLQHKVGPRAADALRVPFSLGDPDRLKAIFHDAGIEAKLARRQGTVNYPSVRSWVLTDVTGWFPMVDVDVDKQMYEELIQEAEHALHAFVQPNGTVVFPISVHIALATR
ncbi:MAG TPA: methyltransferase domain-containing protein [Candidatus Krumholzibacteria bacterium]